VSGSNRYLAKVKTGMACANEVRKNCSRCICITCAYRICWNFDIIPSVPKAT
jgi:hypothetical protein